MIVANLRHLHLTTKLKADGHYDDYHETRAREFAALGRWNTAILEAAAIYNQARSKALMAEIEAMEATCQDLQ